jgi:hypothetical protein
MAHDELRPVVVGPGKGRTIQGPEERFFDRFAELPDGPVDPGVFARLGGEVGMEVRGPPLAVSHPL